MQNKNTLKSFLLLRSEQMLKDLFGDVCDVDISEIINTRYQHYRAAYRTGARTILTIETADLEIGIFQSSQRK